MFILYAESKGNAHKSGYMSIAVLHSTDVYLKYNGHVRTLAFRVLSFRLPSALLQYSIHVRLLTFRLLSSLSNVTAHHSCTHFRVHSLFSLPTVQRSCGHTYMLRTLETAEY